LFGCPIPLLLPILTRGASAEVDGSTLNVFLEVDEAACLDSTFRPFFQLWGTSKAAADTPGAFARPKSHTQHIYV
jgi:hypothetical protein